MEETISISKHDVYGPYAVLECSQFLPLLYSGKGALLCVHSVDGKLLYTCQPFDAQNIHGVREVCCNNGDVVELLAFSDKCIRHLELRYDRDGDGDGIVTLQIVNRFKLFDDFIWDCALVNDKRQLVVGFAHNRVHVYTIRDANTDGDGSLELVGDVRCTPQCVLYCMNLCTANSTTASNANGRMLVASGTCFHDVTLWFMSDNAADAEVKCTLKGHTGVVFRMKFCEATMTLLTVSDDRTARLWSVQDGRELAVFWGHTDRVWDATFCGEYVVTSSEDSTVKIWKRDGTCLATLWGHSDDSWRLAARQLSDGSHVVYSAGADGSVKVWPVEYHLQNSAQETIMASIPLPLLERPPLAAPGNNNEEEKDEEQPMEQEDTATTAEAGDENDDDDEKHHDDDDQPQQKKQKKKQKKKSKKSKGGSTTHRQSTICSIRICRDTAEMVVCVNDGSVWRCRGAESLHDLQYSWHDVSPRMAVDAAPLSEPIGAFNVSWARGLSMVAHPSGAMSLCSLETGVVLHQWQPHVRRTLNMWMFERSERGDVLLVTSSSDNTCAVWRLQQQQEAQREAQDQTPELVVVVHMQKGEDATAACLANDVLLVGDKVGNLHVVDLRLVGEDVKAVEPHQTLRRVHGREIVSSIAVWPAVDSVTSLGHDGDLVLYSWHERSLQLRDRLTAHPISIPETVWTVDKTLLVGGWHGSHYMIWDVINRYQFLKIDGGSWRRCHTSSLSGNPAFPIPFFVCSLPRKGELTLSVHRLAGAQLAVPDRCCFHPSGHGKPVLCSVWLNPAADRPDLATLVTAGQDGRVLVWRTQQAPQSHRQGQDGGVELWQLQQPLTGHITIMRALAVSDSFGSTGVLAAGGGKLTINLWRYQPDAEGPLQFRFVTQHCLWKKATQDHRIFCLQAIPCPFGSPTEDDSSYWVIAGDSRSMLTVSELRASSGECSIVAELPFDGYPLLCCRSLVLSSSSATLVLTVVGTTNGDLHLAQCGLQLSSQDAEAAPSGDSACSILDMFTAHQMGANCVDMRLASCTEDSAAGLVHCTVSIVSGGDDQAIAVTQARVSVDLHSRQVSCAHLFTEIVTDSAGSALKSIAFTQEGQHCVSVGYDQRLSVWRLNLPEPATTTARSDGEKEGESIPVAEARYRRTCRRDSTHLRCATAAVVNVGDVSGLSVAATTTSESDSFIRVAVTGQGMQLARIHISSGGNNEEEATRC